MHEAEAQKHMEKYMLIQGSAEAKRNLAEALALLTIADKKQKSVLYIMTKLVLPAAA